MTLGGIGAVEAGASPALEVAVGATDVQASKPAAIRAKGKSLIRCDILASFPGPNCSTTGVTQSAGSLAREDDTQHRALWQPTKRPRYPGRSPVWRWAAESGLPTMGER